MVLPTKAKKHWIADMDVEAWYLDLTVHQFDHSSWPLTLWCWQHSHQHSCGSSPQSLVVTSTALLLLRSFNSIIESHLDRRHPLPLRRPCMTLRDSLGRWQRYFLLTNCYGGLEDIMASAKVLIFNENSRSENSPKMRCCIEIQWNSHTKKNPSEI